MAILPKTFVAKRSREENFGHRAVIEPSRPVPVVIAGLVPAISIQTARPYLIDRDGRVSLAEFTLGRAVGATRGLAARP
jgi:hypothetical protein